MVSPTAAPRCRFVVHGLVLSRAIFAEEFQLRGSSGLGVRGGIDDSAMAVRTWHIRHGMYTSPPQPEQCRGGPLGFPTSISGSLADVLRLRRFPLAMAPTVPRLTPVMWAILRL